MRMRIAVGLLALEVAGVVYARFSPTRYFAWAMFHTQAPYTLDVTVRGRHLRPGQIARRYRIPAAGTEPRAIAHTIDVVRTYERTRGADQDARVVLRYREGRGPAQEWRWPGP